MTAFKYYLSQAAGSSGPSHLPPDRATKETATDTILKGEERLVAQRCVFITPPMSPPHAEEGMCCSPVSEARPLVTRVRGRQKVSAVATTAIHRSRRYFSQGTCLLQKSKTREGEDGGEAKPRMLKCGEGAALIGQAPSRSERYQRLGPISMCIGEATTR